MWRYQPDSDTEYVGNIWGWKFSIFGAILIVVMLALAAIIASSRGKSIIDGGRLSAPVEQSSEQ